MKRIVLFFLLAALLTACVPTPETEYVTGKQDGNLAHTITGTLPVAEYAIEQQAKPDEPVQPPAPDAEAVPTGETPEHTDGAVTLRAALGAPERVSETVSGRVYGGTMDVHTDAEVVLPGVTEIPVFRVAFGGFTPEGLQKTAAELIGSGPYYRFAGGYSRTRYEKEMRRYQTWLDALDSMPYGPNADYDEIRSELSWNLSVMQREYARAEADRKRTAWTGAWTDVTCSVSDADGNTFTWSQDGAKNANLMYQRLDDIWYTEDPIRPTLRTADERKADEAARAFLGCMHGTETKLYGIAASDEGCRNHAGVETGWDEGVYILQYMPVYAGIPVYPWETYHGTDNGQQDAEVHYDRDARQERIKCVTENGAVTYAYWDCPMTVLGVENANVRLLPFDRIMEIFRQQIYMNIYIGKDYLGNESHTDLYVVSIRLSYMRVREKDTDGYWLLPVWDFRGYDGMSAGIDSWWDNFSLLTVNAIDGSIIDRGLGY